MDNVRWIMSDGWLNGEGLAPTKLSISIARKTLSQLVECLNMPMASAFPTPDGNIQAEWHIGSWSIDAIFNGNENFVEAGATNTNSRKNHDEKFEISDDLTRKLFNWI